MKAGTDQNSNALSLAHIPLFFLFSTSRKSLTYRSVSEPARSQLLVRTYVYFSLPNTHTHTHGTGAQLAGGNSSSRRTCLAHVYPSVRTYSLLGDKRRKRRLVRAIASSMRALAIAAIALAAVICSTVATTILLLLFLPNALRRYPHPAANSITW